MRRSEWADFEEMPIKMCSIGPATHDQDMKRIEAQLKWSYQQIEVFNFSSYFQLNSLLWERRVRVRELDFPRGTLSQMDKVINFDKPSLSES